MFYPTKKKFAMAGLLAMAMLALLLPQSQINAADHNDGTMAASNPDADIADVYAFLDPNDNTKVILAMDVHGFITPQEMGTLGFFDSNVLEEFQIENNGTAKPNITIDVTFSAPVAAGTPQTATIKLSTGQGFTAPATFPNESATATPFTVTTDPTTGVSFFAGPVDDPFFFDLVGFGRFVNSVLAKAADPTQLQRGRDAFAGYNTRMIALSVPATLLKGTTSSTIGVGGATFMRKKTTLLGDGTTKGSGGFVQIDRMGNPAVNAELIPFAMKNEYNASTPEDDAKGKFASAIEATLTALGTNSSNIGTLASVAVTGGDLLHLNLSTPNTSLGVLQSFGSAGYSGFPNGRRPGDDVVATIILLVTNEGITSGDSVPQNDVAFGTTFPFFAPPHQPQAPGSACTTEN
jgi:hypothetical protein